MEKIPEHTKIRYKIMREFVGNTSSKVILDIGAGYMPISKGITSKKTFRLDGVKKYEPEIVADINKGLPLKDSSVDVVIAGEIIEHIYNPIKFIRECNRVLKKEGILVLSTPNTCSIKNRFRVFFGKLPEHCARPSEDESFERHIIDFNLPVLVQILRENRFRTVKKSSNGVIFHGKNVFPRLLTPASFGEIIIIKAEKIENMQK